MSKRAASQTPLSLENTTKGYSLLLSLPQRNNPLSNPCVRYHYIHLYTFTIKINPVHKKQNIYHKHQPNVGDPKKDLYVYSDPYIGSM